MLKRGAASLPLARSRTSNGDRLRARSGLRSAARRGRASETTGSARGHPHACPAFAAVRRELLRWKRLFGDPSPLAAHLSRKHGLPPPVAVTNVIPGDAAASEDEWQESVIGHLGIADWERIRFTHELDVVGPIATPLLQRFGPYFPFNGHFLFPGMQSGRGGTYLSGVGGDELFDSGETDRLSLILTRQVRPNRHDLVMLARRVQPLPLRIRRRHWIDRPGAVAPARGRTAVSSRSGKYRGNATCLVLESAAARRLAGSQPGSRRANDAGIRPAQRNFQCPALHGACSDWLTHSPQGPSCLAEPHARHE